jgi:hypothetical protein
MLVIMPHFWKWHRFSFDELKRLGVDGFEVYNCGYRNIDSITQQKLIELTKKNNLLAIGSTDWHGWGYMTDVWTVFQGSLDKDIKTQLSAKPQIKVILYRQAQSSSILRFIFEPFSALYYYLKNASSKMTVAFITWIILLFAFFSNKQSKHFVNKLPLILTFVFAFATIYFIAIYIPVRQTNKILFFNMAPISSCFSLIWFCVYKMNNKN